MQRFYPFHKNERPNRNLLTNLPKKLRPPGGRKAIYQPPLTPMIKRHNSSNTPRVNCNLSSLYCESGLSKIGFCQSKGNSN